MRKPKILFAVQLPPPVHGASLVNKTLTESSVVNEQYDIEVIQIQMASSMESLGQFSVRKIWNSISLFFRFFLKILFNKYDLFYFTLSPLGFAFYKDAILVMMIKLFGGKIVYHLHGKGIKDELESGFKKKVYEFVFRNTEVIQLAEVLAEDINAIYSGKPYVLANGIVDVAPELLKSESNESITTFIYLSNLMAEKGILLFLDSIRALKGMSEQFKIYIVGPSADVSLKQVEDFIKNEGIVNVEVVGPLYGNDKYAYFRKSDVFVLPTFYKNECFPLSILEAYQAGLVVLSTDNGAIPSMVKDSVNGFIIPQNNSAELTKRMKYLIEHPEIQQEIKSTNRAVFEERYTEKIFISNFIEIIDDILAQK